MSIKILYIEDEMHLATIVKETLQMKGFDVVHLPDGLELKSQLTKFKPDICVFDVMLPHLDGFQLGQLVRNLYPQLPIIFLTAKSQTADVIEGFSSGGTDYLKKPFSLEELIVRINNQYKIGSNKQVVIPADPGKSISLGEFMYYPIRLELQHPTQRFKLSNREAEVLNELCKHKNVVIDRREMMKRIWQDDSYFISRNLDVYINKLRSYFSTGKGVEIITLKGKGYIFNAG
jgi:DNA-binding response OmpR family regulator